jgi:hypothetical protein
MFKKLLGRLTGSAPPSAATTAASEPWEAELLQRIEEMSGEDPLIGAKVGGKQLAQIMLATMKNEQGVHVESILGALGSLAGYSCQMSVRAQARAQGLDETAPFIRVEGVDGKLYFFGDVLNRPLAEDHSVWSLAAGEAQTAGCMDIPDPGEVFTHVVNTVGGPEFGLPRLPQSIRCTTRP